jgi:hypothetical protein
MTVAVYRNEDCGLNECSRVYGVPQATIRRHVMKQIWYVSGVRALGRQATLFGDTKEILADHIIMLKECFWGRGLSIKDVRKLEFDLAEKYKLPHTFNKEKMLVGKQLIQCIYAKKSSTVCSATRGYPLARAQGSNRDNVLHVSDLLGSNIATFGFTPDKIFNLDEPGFSTVQRRPHKIVAQKGKHQVGLLQVANEGSTPQWSAQ